MRTASGGFVNPLGEIPIRGESLDATGEIRSSRCLAREVGNGIYAISNFPGSKASFTEFLPPLVALLPLRPFWQLNKFVKVRLKKLITKS